MNNDNQNKDNKIDDGAKAAGNGQQPIPAPMYGAYLPTADAGTVNSENPNSTVVEKHNSSDAAGTTKTLHLARPVAFAIALCLVLIAGGAGIVSGFMFGKESHSAQVLAEEKAQADKDLQKAKKDYNKISYEYSEAKRTIDDAENIKSSIDDLQQQQNDLQTKVNALKQQYDQAKGQPIQLPAGEFTVGKEVPEGRYVISGSSNFKTFDSSGDIDINTILGDSEVGDGDYHGYLPKGYYIKNYAPATLTPVE